MKKHTPGPWTYRNDVKTGDYGITAPGCGVFAESFADIRHAYEWAFDEAQANASLIAAAPDLLEALEGVLWMAEEWFAHGGDETTLADDYRGDIASANAAIAKARGEV